MANAPAVNKITAPRESGGAQRRLRVGSLSIARALLVATLLVAPLTFGAVNTWAWASLTVLGALSLLVWGIGSFLKGSVKILWTPIYLPASLFLLLGIIQFTGHLTLDSMGTREFLVKLFTDLILFFLANQLLANASDTSKRRVGLIVTIYLFLFSLFSILQFFTANRLIYWTLRTEGLTFGPYVNPNHYAGLLEMLIPLAGTYVLSQPKSDHKRALLGFAILIAIASVLLAGSRGGFVALIGEILILSAMLLWRRSRREGQRLATAGTLVIVASVLLFFWIDPGQVSKHLAAVINPQSEPDFVLRIAVAKDSLRIFRDHPWIGTGLGSFATAYPPYQSIPTDLIWDHAHNDYAEVLVESGLVGGLLVLWALILFWRIAFKNLDGRSFESSKWMQLGATLACCGLLVHSFVDFNLHIPANAAWFSACVGMAQRNFVSSSHEARVQSLRVN